MALDRISSTNTYQMLSTSTGKIETLHANICKLPDNIEESVEVGTNHIRQKLVLTQLRKTIVAFVNQFYG